MKRSLCKIFYITGALLPLLISLSRQPLENPLRQIGTAVAMIGIMLLSFQILLAGRFRWIERSFGLDSLLQYHKKVALVAALLLLAHPLLLVADGSGMALLTSLDLPWYIWAGKVALLLLLLNIVLSSFQTKLKISFERWRSTHDVAAILLILLAFIHSGVTGHDIRRLPVLQILWVIIPILFLILFTYHLVIKPWLLYRRPFQVIEVEKDGNKVYTLKFAPPEGLAYNYLPGQFQFITLYRKNLPIEEHHWTISSSPTQKNYVASTIKEMGDFTATIGLTQPGDVATVDGPYGRFSYLLYPDEQDVVFIAGGIGITPLIAMLRHMKATNSSIPVLLIYASEQEIIFRDELDEMERHQYFPLRVIHVLSHPKADWHGEQGHVDKEKIKKFADQDLSKKSFYLSGPKGLVEGSVKALKEMGVTSKKIHVEYFSFVD
jgi:predicted ferric reductase